MRSRMMIMMMLMMMMMMMMMMMDDHNDEQNYEQNYDKRPVTEQQTWHILAFSGGSHSELRTAF